MPRLIEGFQYRLDFGHPDVWIIGEYVGLRRRWYAPWLKRGVVRMLEFGPALGPEQQDVLRGCLMEVPKEARVRVHALSTPEEDEFRQLHAGA